jgi:hypothetical protein
VPPEVEELILHAMERDPRRRIQTAAEMKEQLMDPSLVKLTGRYHHLRVPQVWTARWHSMRLTIMCVAGPVLLFALMLLLTRCHPHHH